MEKRKKKYKKPHFKINGILMLIGLAISIEEGQNIHFGNY